MSRFQTKLRSGTPRHPDCTSQRKYFDQISAFFGVEKHNCKLGHISPDRLKKLSNKNSVIPKFEQEIISQHHCVPYLVGKAERSFILPSLRRTNPTLLLIHLNISGPVEAWLEGYRYTVAALMNSQQLHFTRHQ